MENKNKKILLLGLLSTLVATLLHAYLTSKFYALNFGQATGLSACNINAVFNCDATSASPYAQLFGSPIALWGALTNLIILFFAVISYFGWAERPDRAHRAAWFLSLVSAATSIVMGIVSAFLIGAICLYCVATYVLSFVTLFCIHKTAEKPVSWGQEFKSYLIEEKWIIVLFLLVPAGAFLSHKSIVNSYGFERIDSIVQEKVQTWLAEPNVQNFSMDSGLISKGPAEPIMTIVEFADYLCPHCKHAYPTLHAFSQSRPDVQLVFKSFPLDGTCTPDPKMGPGDGLRCKLSLAVICNEKLFKQGWNTHHYIFDHQEEFYQTPWEQIQPKICSAIKGVQCDQLKTCIDSEEAMTELKKQAQEGIQAKISGTPSIFVNGKLLSGGQALPVLEKAYQSLKK